MHFMCMFWLWILVRFCQCSNPMVALKLTLASSSGGGAGNEATAHSCHNCTITSQPVSLECTPGLGGNQSGCPHLEQFLLSVGRREPHSLEKGTQCSKVSRRKYLWPLEMVSLILPAKPFTKWERAWSCCKPSSGHWGKQYNHVLHICFVIRRWSSLTHCDVFTINSVAMGVIHKEYNSATFCCGDNSIVAVEPFLSLQRVELAMPMDTIYIPNLGRWGKYLPTYTYTMLFT